MTTETKQPLTPEFHAVLTTGGMGRRVYLYDGSGVRVDLDEGNRRATMLNAADEMLRVLRIVQATLPHMGGNERGTWHIMQDVNAAIAKATS